MRETIRIKTGPGMSLVNITDQVQAIVQKSQVNEGLCILVVPHTTAAITLNSYLDPATATDLVGEMDRIVPTRLDFAHQHDTPSDAAGHIKASLIGNSQTVMVEQGRLLLGHSQAIMFFEFDGPRERSVHVKVIRGV